LASFDRYCAAVIVESAGSGALRVVQIVLTETEPVIHAAFGSLISADQPNKSRRKSAVASQLVNVAQRKLSRHS
jgi:hypothetical protein